MPLKLLRCYVLDPSRYKEVLLYPLARLSEEDAKLRACHPAQQSKVVMSKLLPLFWIVLEPVAKGISRSYFLQPSVQMQRLPLYAARPQPLY